MIAAVATIINEGDILGYTLKHLHLEGVDSIYIALAESTDTTATVLETARRVLNWEHFVVVEDEETCHRQPYWIERLADLAGADGAEWIVPFDADEFIYAVDGGTIATALNGLPEHVKQVDIPMFRHLNWNTRIEISTLPKVAYRYAPGITVANGNHGCSAGGTHVMGILALREICYRGFDHFVDKTRERNALIDPTLATGEGAHQRQYAGMTEDQLRDAWAGYCALPTVKDPIPSRLKVQPPLERP